MEFCLFKNDLQLCASVFFFVVHAREFVRVHVCAVCVCVVCNIKRRSTPHTLHLTSHTAHRR